MCPPKAPKMKDIAVPPQRQAAVLPDGGDPMVRQGLKNMKELSRSTMIFTSASGNLGLPSTATLGGGST